MTQLLERALAEIQKLSVPEQDAIAAVILDELADDGRRDEAFAGTSDRLTRLAEKVRADVEAGRVHEIGWDEL